MGQVIYKDRFVIVSRGTLTVGNTTYPLSGIRSFSVFPKYRWEPDVPKARKMFWRWLAGFMVGVVAVWFLFLNALLPPIAFIGLLLFGALGAAYVTWRCDYKKRVLDEWWLRINLNGVPTELISSPDENYIRNIGAQIGSAMADR